MRIEYCVFLHNTPYAIRNTKLMLLISICVAKQNSFCYTLAMNETGLNLKIVESIKDIPQDDWNRLFGNELIEGYGYHKTIEESNIGDFEIKYLIGLKKESINLIIPFFIIEYSIVQLLPRPFNRLFACLKKLLKLRMIFCGIPTAEEFYFGIDKNENIGETFKRASEYLLEFSKKQKICALVFNNFSNNHPELIKYLKSASFFKMETLPRTLIEIKGNSLEEFISLLSKNTRKDLKKKLKKTSGCAKIKTIIYEDPKDILTDIYNLYLNNLIAADLNFEKLTPEFFEKIAQNMPKETKYFITFKDSKIVAFNLLFVKDNRCIDKFIGFDKEESRNLHLYFYTFVHNIDWCIKNRVNFYEPGITDYYPKVRLGAKLIPLFIYAKAISPFLNFIMKKISPFIEPKNLDPSLKKILKEKKDCYL